MKDFRDLQVWHKAHQLVLRIYKETNSFPRQEVYGLTAQIRRAALSIASNISEGCGRDSDADLARFLQMAAGSASEVEYQLLLSYDLGWLEDESYRRLNADTCEIKRMLASLIKKLRASTKTQKIDTPLPTTDR